MFPKTVSLLAPIGAALVITYSALTGHAILLEFGAALGENRPNALPSGHLIGVIGLLLTGLGVTAATLSRRVRSAPVVCLLVAGTLAFGLAALFVGFGNWQLRAAFMSLATAEQIDSEAFIRQVGKARSPLLAGWFFALGGAVSVFAADLTGARDVRPSVNSLSRAFSVAAALVALVVSLLSGVWSVVSLRHLTDIFSLPQSDPASLASGTMGVINAALLAAVGLASCASASLFMAGAADAPARQSMKNQATE